MKKSELKKILIDLDIDASSISFYTTRDGLEAPDLEFGFCQISYVEGDLVECVALSLDHKHTVAFRASHSLVHGALGSLAGAF
jgi:hypothetical protein